MDTDCVDYWVKWISQRVNVVFDILTKGNGIKEAAVMSVCFSFDK